MRILAIGAHPDDIEFGMGGLMIKEAEKGSTVKYLVCSLGEAGTMSAITSHVLDTSLGRPAAGVAVTLAALEAGKFQDVGQGVTDSEGRVRHLLGAHPLAVGVYRLTFDTGAHFQATGRASFYERVEIQFRVTDPSEHYHVPLLLSPFGYSTYRGS